MRQTRTTQSRPGLPSGQATRHQETRLTGVALANKAAAMTSRISHTSFDALDAYAQSVFWSRVLDFMEDPDDPNEPGHEECLIMSKDRSQLLLFITVPDGKIVKNRVHLDLRPTDSTREEETERVVAFGATQLADHRRPDGSGWITLADPEGNEFCILSKDPARSGATT
jgi:predicted enzyme related to lactoylglutathione lyase